MAPLTNSFTLEVAKVHNLHQYMRENLRYLIIF